MLFLDDSNQSFATSFAKTNDKSFYGVESTPSPPHSASLAMSLLTLRVHIAPAFASPARLSLSTHRHLPSLSRRPRHSRFLAMSATPRFPARTAVITGASGGIGAETAAGLVRDLTTLTRLFLCVRNVAKGESIAEPLRADGRVDVKVVPVELSSATSVRACAERLTAELGDDPLDLLLCNAGIMAPPLGFAEQEGEGEFARIEQQFFVNHLSHALLTQRLLPLLRRGEGGRVIFVSSMAASLARARESAPVIAEKTPAALNQGSYARWGAYAESKLAMSMYACSLARREESVESVSLHPGIVQTELVRYVLPERLANMMNAGAAPNWLQRGLSWFGLKTPQQGAELSLELACMPRGEVDDGNMYVAKGGKKMRDSMAPLLRNEVECDKVFEDAQRFVDGF